MPYYKEDNARAYKITWQYPDDKMTLEYDSSIPKLEYEYGKKDGPVHKLEVDYLPGMELLTKENIQDFADITSASAKTNLKEAVKENTIENETEDHSEFTKDCDLYRAVHKCEIREKEKKRKTRRIKENLWL